MQTHKQTVHENDVFIHMHVKEKQKQVQVSIVTLDIGCSIYYRLPR